MKDILVRALSGIVYIAILIISIYNPTLLLITLFSFALICVYELKKLLNEKHIWIAYALLTCIFIGIGYHQFINPLTYFNTVVITLLAISISINVLLIINLYARSSSSYNLVNKILMVTSYCSFAFLFISLVPYYKNNYYPELLLGCFIIIWSNDTFAYLTGRFFGKHKLFERISPKKTIEGFVGGLLFALVTGYVLSLNFDVLSLAHWLILALLVSIFGTYGDLVESKMKRQAHVKDSGKIMPGHGGLLDRLDSIIFAAPFVYVFLIILQYVL